MHKFVLSLVAPCAIVALSGCTMTDASLAVPAAPVALVEPAVIGVPTETTIVTQATVTQTTVTRSTTPTSPTPTTVDILSNMKKPCGSVAADAPKFVTPETETK